MVINRPTGQLSYANEAQDDEVWLWSGFMPSGAYTFTVDDPINPKQTTSVFVGSRTQDLTPNQFSLAEEGSSDAHNNVFANWQVDTQLTYEILWNQDCKVFSSSNFDLGRLKEIFLPRYRELNLIHTVLSTHCVCYPAIDFEQFNQFCTRFWSDHDLNFAGIFRKCNHEQPILRCHFLKGLVLIAEQIHRQLQEENDGNCVEFHTFMA